MRNRNRCPTCGLWSDVEQVAEKRGLVGGIGWAIKRVLSIKNTTGAYDPLKHEWETRRANIAAILKAQMRELEAELAKEDK